MFKLKMCLENKNYQVVKWVLQDNVDDKKGRKKSPKGIGCVSCKPILVKLPDDDLSYLVIHKGTCMHPCVAVTKESVWRLLQFEGSHRLENLYEHLKSNSWEIGPVEEQYLVEKDSLPYVASWENEPAPAAEAKAETEAEAAAPAEEAAARAPASSSAPKKNRRKFTITNVRRKFTITNVPSKGSRFIIT